MRPRDWLRILRVVAQVATLGLVETAEAGTLYAVRDLGAFDTTQHGYGDWVYGPNYLPALDPADQAAFRAGSFDPWSHPATEEASSQMQQAHDALYPSHGQATVARLVAISGNDHGQLVGQESVRNLVSNWVISTSAITYTPGPENAGHGSFATLTSMPSDFVTGIVINNDGLVAGFTYYPTGIGATFVGEDYQVALGGPNNSSPRALNQAGQVVGASYHELGPNNNLHAFLYDYHTKVIQDLNDLIPSSAGIVLTDALAIDADGRIAALGSDESGVVHEYLLTPVPEPGTWTMFGLVAAGLAAQRVRRPRG